MKTDVGVGATASVVSVKLETMQQHVGSAGHILPQQAMHPTATVPARKSTPIKSSTGQQSVSTFDEYFTN